MTDILICGIGGKMGATLVSLLQGDSEARVVCGVDAHTPQGCTVPVYPSFKDVREKVDVVIDFSSPTVVADELTWAIEHNTPVVLASTGYDRAQLDYIDDCAKKVAIFKTANFSLGVNLIVKLVNEAASVLGEKFDVEIIERHHNLKADAPSGTALMLADSVNAAFNSEKPYLCGREGKVGKRANEIGIHAVRGGTIVGEHEVMFAGEDEVITITHSARSKKVFAAGAIAAAKWLKGKPPAKYDMKDIL